MTPDDNIGDDGYIIDREKIKNRNWRWAEAVLVWDETNKEERMVGVQDISTFSHWIIEDGILHRILHMLSKKDESKPEPAGCRCLNPHD